MPPVRRRLLNFLTLLSLLVCVAAAALWVRGYWSHDYFTYARPGLRYYVDGGRGSVEFTRAESPSVNVARRELDFGGSSFGAARPPSWGAMYPDDGNRTALLGVIYYHRAQPGLDFRALVLPFWLITAAAGVAPAVVIPRRLVVRRRLRRGLCRSCGYDLRATPGRCPECGRAAGAS